LLKKFPLKFVVSVVKALLIFQFLSRLKHLFIRQKTMV
jgi:hypothetical protein